MFCVLPQIKIVSDFVPGILVGLVLGQFPSDGRTPEERSRESKGASLTQMRRAEVGVVSGEEGPGPTGRRA